MGAEREQRDASKFSVLVVGTLTRSLGVATMERTGLPGEAPVDKVLDRGAYAAGRRRDRDDLLQVSENSSASFGSDLKPVV